jgi:hypothetical protein
MYHPSGAFRNHLTRSRFALFCSSHEDQMTDETLSFHIPRVCGTLQLVSPRARMDMRGPAWTGRIRSSHTNFRTSSFPVSCGNKG